MPIQPKKKPARRCWRCRVDELSLIETPKGITRRFKLLPSKRGKGPECPPYTGCHERARDAQQYNADLLVQCDEQITTSR